MTEKHATEAKRFMRNVLSACETDENTGALIGIIAAQTHATLALVEQQRIANVIALTALDADTDEKEVLSREAALALIEYQEDPDGSLDEDPVIRLEISTALGVSDE